MQFSTRPRRALAILLLVAVASAVPTFVFASHVFTDVPSGGFHGDITRVAGAGITSGCAPTKYCPTDFVTRGQMAAFLNRTGGRVAYDTNGITFNVSSDTELASVTIRAGNVEGGTAFIALEVSGYTYTNGNNETGCVPCGFQARIVRDGGGASNFTFYTIHNSSAAEQEAGTSAISWVTAVPTGVDQTFRVIGSRSRGTGTINAVISFTATYIPFGPTGGNSLAGAGGTTVFEVAEDPTPSE